MEFGLTAKIGEKRPRNRENGPKTAFKGNVSAIFPLSGPFFPNFRGEAKIDFSAIFSYFGPEARTDFLSGGHVRDP